MMNSESHCYNEYKHTVHSWQWIFTGSGQLVRCCQNLPEVFVYGYRGHSPILIKAQNVTSVVGLV